MVATDASSRLLTQAVVLLLVGVGLIAAALLWQQHQIATAVPDGWFAMNGEVEQWLEGTAALPGAAASHAAIALGGTVPADEPRGMARIELNSATVDELQLLPGIGASRAEAIIAYREREGKFTAPEQLMNVSGIGPVIYERLRERIVVSP